MAFVFIWFSNAQVLFAPSMDFRLAPHAVAGEVYRIGRLSMASCAAKARMPDPITTRMETVMARSHRSRWRTLAS
jgi:hypothetical protein